MKTGSHLKIIQMGDSVQGVRLEGNPKKPEFDEFRVVFPGGDVSVTRCTDNTYWVHVRADHKDHPALCPGEFEPALITEARLDILGKNVSETNIGDFADHSLYHVALRVARVSVLDSIAAQEVSRG